MKRKQFLLTSLSALPLLAFRNTNPFSIENSSKKPFVIRSGKSRFGEPMKYKGMHPNDVVISRKDTGDALSVFVFTGHAKIGPSLHLHLNQDEFFYVAAGNYRFVAGDETMELSEGDTIFLPRNVPHTWIQLSEHGRLFYAVQPAGTLEEFFKEMNDLKKPPTEEESRAIHAKHGMMLIGPPLKL